MIKHTQLSLFIVIALLLFSCKSQFEKVRISGDPERQLKAANTYYEKGQYLKAQTLYELIITSYRGKQEATELFYRYAYTHYYLKNYILASHYFQAYSEKFISSPHREDAMYMYAYTNYLLSPSYKLDQKYTMEAINALQFYANSYPQSEKISTINDLIDKLRKKLQVKAIKSADLYYKMEAYQAAVRTFQHVLQDFPETSKNEEIRFKIIDSQYQLAENSIYELKYERAKKTLQFIEVFIDKYPKSTYLERVEIIQEQTNNLINSLENGRHKVTSSGSQS